MARKKKGKVKKIEGHGRLSRFEELYKGVTRFSEPFRFIIVMALALIVSGLIYGLIRQGGAFVQLAGGSLSVIFPGLRDQTYTEIPLVFVYYMLGFFGLLLYVRAMQQRVSERGLAYSMTFATILVLMSFLGLLLTFGLKIG